MAEVVAQIVKHFDYNGPVGCGFPSVIKNGVCITSGNLSKKWIGTKADALFTETCGMPVTVINDADAAGYASMEYGVGKGEKGFVVMITVGTGLGSGAFLDGELIPNFELGQIPYKKYEKIELWAASSAREKEELSYDQWGKRFNKFLKYVELIIAPELIIVGGGASKNWEEYKHRIKIGTRVIPAELQNHAGIIGAAAALAHNKVV